MKKDPKKHPISLKRVCLVHQVIDGKKVFSIIDDRTNRIIENFNYHKYAMDCCYSDGYKIIGMHCLIPKCACELKRGSS